MSGAKTGKIVEIFSSIQGEGLYCGQRQTFIRLAGCNLSCAYCDTPAALEACDFIEYTAYDAASRCAKFGVRDITITGGEPLLQIEFLEKIINVVRNEPECTVHLPNSRFHLETNGILFEQMKILRDSVDIVAMDIKLPSATGLDQMWDLHAQFLRSCRSERVFVKIVVSAETPVCEITTAAELIAERSSDIPVVIQPVTGNVQIEAEKLMDLQDNALNYLSDVRVIPQCHKILGVR